jgi:hypothetical protein
MGFRHHNFHPMKADAEKIWQVQYVDLRTGGTSSTGGTTGGTSSTGGTTGDTGGTTGGTTGSTGGTGGTSSTGGTDNYVAIYGGFFPADILPIQEKCDYKSIGKGTITTKIIELKCMSSFINAYLYINKNYIEGDTAEDKCEDVFIPQYGYILRYSGQTIIIKSPLLKTIEKLIYKYHKDYKIYSENLNHLNRMQYIAMRAFLKNGKDDIYTSYRQQFLLLFPEWSSKFADFNKFTSELIEKIACHFSQRGLSSCSVPKKDLTPIDNLSYRLYLIIKKDYKLTINYEEVISNYVHNPEYAFIYINFI